MRYTAIEILGSGEYTDVHTIPIYSFIGGKAVWACEDAIERFKGAEMNIVRKKKGLVYLEGGYRSSRRIVAVREDHPAFNGGMFLQKMTRVIGREEEIFTKALVDIVTKVVSAK